MPGVLSVTNNLNVGGGVTVNGDSNFNCNNITYKGWAIHRTGDNRILFAPSWGDWGNSCAMYSDGGFGCKNINTTAIETGSLKIGKWRIMQDQHEHLIFIKDGVQYNGDYNQIPVNTGFVAIASDGNIWFNRRTSTQERNWLSGIIDNKLTVNANGDINVSNVYASADIHLIGPNRWILHHPSNSNMLQITYDKDGKGNYNWDDQKMFKRGVGNKSY